MASDRVTLKDIYEAINELRDEMSTNYVTKQEFWPVKTIVYAGAGIIMVSVFTAMVYLVVNQGGL